MDGVEEREAMEEEPFSPPGLGVRSPVLIPATGSGPARGAAAAAVATGARMAGLGCAWSPGLQMRWWRSQSLCWQKEPQ